MGAFKQNHIGLKYSLKDRNDNVTAFKRPIMQGGPRPTEPSAAEELAFLIFSI